MEKILAVGIGYNKKDKKHHCLIENIRLADQWDL